MMPLASDGLLAAPMPVDASLETSLLALRRAIHAEPELAFSEVATQQKLEKALATIAALPARRVAGTGLVARIPGTHPDRATLPAVAVRGDIDALPITEATGVPWASTTPGVMHACGHDVHATWAVGAAALLRRAPAACDVIILLQPAEEIGQGAVAMIADGALDGVAVIYGGHVDRRFTIGQVVADVGPLAASTDEFVIEVVGHGAHAARPHESADPVVAQAALVLALQTLVSRRLNPSWPGVVTVGAVQAGEAPNVIPERALLRGTIRTTTPDARRVLTTALGEVAVDVVRGYGCEARVTLTAGSPPVINTAREVAWARAAVARVLGEQALVPLGIVNMAGEDFAHYLERVPGAFLRIGAREGNGPVMAAHSPRFLADDGCVAVGAAVLAACAREAAAGLAAERAA
ncbi:MAG: M20 family metallopeptidase [Gemmatimonadaceae bacterium]|nr:M20 family metallopeptidase [Gemmatimonadaceae bacterium]